MLSVAGGLIKGLRLESPQGSQTRPSAERLRQAVYNVLRHYRGESGGSLVEGATVADVFAGTGAFGIEAASEGAAEVFFIESHPLSLECLKKNLKTASSALHNQSRRVRFAVAPTEVESSYAKLPVCDVVFCDPPYEKGWFFRVLGLEASGGRVKKGGLFIFEERVGSVDEVQMERLALLAGLRLFDKKNYGDSNVYFFVKP